MVFGRIEMTKNNKISNGYPILQHPVKGGLDFRGCIKSPQNVFASIFLRSNPLNFERKLGDCHVASLLATT
jgi:hypothetical protein